MLEHQGPLCAAHFTPQDLGINFLPKSWRAFFKIKSAFQNGLITRLFKVPYRLRFDSSSPHL